MTEVRNFARGDYAVALNKGQDLTAAERDAIAERMSKYTGLSVTYLKEANLRVSQQRYRKELMRDERRTLGRYDGRFEGIDEDAAGENPQQRSGRHAIRGAFTGAFNDYLARELNYSSDVSLQRVGEWREPRVGFQAHDSWSAAAGAVADMGSDLGDAMRTNPHLKVLSANGYFDLATPFFATEYDLGHMDIDSSLRKNLSFTYYPSGHMVYLNLEALKQFKGRPCEVLRRRD